MDNIPGNIIMIISGRSILTETTESVREKKAALWIAADIDCDDDLLIVDELHWDSRHGS